MWVVCPVPSVVCTLIRTTCRTLCIPERRNQWSRPRKCLECFAYPMGSILRSLPNTTRGKNLSMTTNYWFYGQIFSKKKTVATVTLIHRRLFGPGRFKNNFRSWAHKLQCSPSEKTRDWTSAVWWTRTEAGPVSGSGEAGSPCVCVCQIQISKVKDTSSHVTNKTDVPSRLRRSKEPCSIWS